MRLKISTFFEVGTWDRKFLLKGDSTGWFKGTMTNQGLDRCGDSYWFSGVHIGTGMVDAKETSTTLQSPYKYLNKPFSDESTSYIEDDFIVWERVIEYRVENEALPEITEISASWDDDDKTSVALATLPLSAITGDNDDLVVRVKLVVKQSATEEFRGSIDFGASIHEYVIKPCFYKRFDNFFIGYPLSQKDGRVYSGDIPADLTLEPEGSIDTNLAIYESYTFESRSRKFSNFFTLSSPNSYTKTATSHTIGIPSAYGVEFTPPIDKSFNRELTLNYVIKWERDNG
ncbi:tail fiber protein [Acinetobacter phage vB_AbaM_P1]|nr:tail fiber protein [Acinetobacter phage vB_AbaM_P1]WAX22547.1 tail fiber protein [Acinetobacter phage vB_AbaP_HB01]